MPGSTVEVDVGRRRLQQGRPHHSYGYLLNLAIVFSLGARLWLLRQPQSKERMLPANNEASEI
jgi:hypothetical protein